jgi:hypothetical protein
MSERHIHIISFDIPFPANYGGVIDVFYKIKELFKAGIKVHLHAFQYGREYTPILEAYCEEVHYYPRKTGILYNMSSTPYIILSRICGKLIHILEKDSYPILCEGMHTCGLLLSPTLADRKIIYRSSNIEHHYYRGLAKNENNFFKKIYYKKEAQKLENWENNLSKASLFLTVSKEDKKYYENIFPNNKIENIFSFFQQDNIKYVENEAEKYILFHGKLSVQENITSANRIINEIASKSNFKFILAGMNPDKSIIKNTKEQNNIEVISNPDNDKMESLISNAHINLLLTDQPTGLKLKLLNSIYQGKHCLVNENMLVGTGLDKCVNIANSDSEIISSIKTLMQKSFTIDDYKERKNLIPKEFSNSYKVERLINLIFD